MQVWHVMTLGKVNFTWWPD